MKNRIKELRARDGLTQMELAKLVDVRRETIVFLEKGTNLFNGLDLIIFILIISMGIFFFLKSRKRDKENSTRNTCRR